MIYYTVLGEVIYYETNIIFRMSDEKISQLYHETWTAQKLYEANIQSLTADLNAAWIDADKKQESRI